jgi:inorganic pyrophosphatase/exopolyphosphatase
MGGGILSKILFNELNAIYPPPLKSLVLSFIFGDTVNFKTMSQSTKILKTWNFS